MLVIAVALGGMIGAVLRYLLSLSSFMSSSHLFFLKTTVINVLGSALFGFGLAYFEAKARDSITLRTMFFSGFLSSFTTFSAFAHQNVSLILKKNFLWAFLNTLGQVGMSFFLFYLCFRLSQIIFGPPS